MTIRYSKRFEKQFKKLRPKDKQRFRICITLFLENPMHEQLDNHPLKGKFLGLRSISISGDLRALYREIENEIFIYELIGTHSQIYG